MDHQNSLQFPSDVSMSQDAKKLISSFLESGSVTTTASVLVGYDCVLCLGIREWVRMVLRRSKSTTFLGSHNGHGRILEAVSR